MPGSCGRTGTATGPFRIETDARGEPLVHRVDGRHPDSRYTAAGGETTEISESFDLSAGIYPELFIKKAMSPVQMVVYP